jgi:hypothetical protein
MSLAQAKAQANFRSFRCRLWQGATNEARNAEMLWPELSQFRVWPKP